MVVKRRDGMFSIWRCKAFDIEISRTYATKRHIFILFELSTVLYLHGITAIQSRSDLFFVIDRHFVFELFEVLLWNDTFLNV